MTGERVTFREQKKMRVSCTTCSVMVAASYLNYHMTRIHGPNSSTGKTSRVGLSKVRVIKTTSNTRMYNPRVFCVRSGHNQSYSKEFD